MGVIRKLKFNKKIDYLSMNKFTINSGSIIGGELKILPVMRWYFAQSKNNPNVFYIDLTIKLKDYYDIINELDCVKYMSITSPSVLSTDSENNVRYYDPMPSIIGDYHTKYTFDFCSNARADDVYTYGKLIEIIKLVNSEINKALYSENEENINSGDENNNGKIFSAYEINEIIANAHRNYMCDESIKGMKKYFYR